MSAQRPIQVGDLTRDNIMAKLHVPAEHADRIIADLEETERKLLAAPSITDAQQRQRSVIVGWMDEAVVTPWSGPLRESGDWTIGEMEVTARDERFERLRSVISFSSRGRWCPAGTYTCLKRGSATIMSDTPDEIRDLYPFYRALQDTGARRVLIHGLGLGCAVRLAIAEQSVEQIDVVELSDDVVKLVWPTLETVADRIGVGLTLHQGDAYTYRFPPGTRWDVAWHDIFDNISSNNDFATLHRRYGGRVKWQGSWCRDEAERNR